ncbi:MAG: AEC family transporter [Armatimonadetes bacterium]|nr:AEC family transporter [Armatimonadota bacterium]
MSFAISVLIPILLTVGVGFALDRKRSLDPRTLSQVTIYVLTPALGFAMISTTALSGQDFFGIAACLIGLTFLTWLLAKAIAAILHMTPAEENAFILAVVFINAGNYGIPVCTYAFGNAGLDRAVAWVLVQNAFLSSFAVYYAAKGQNGAGKAIRAVFRMPAVYTATLALLLRATGITVPEAVLQPVDMMGKAMVPVAQLLLGIQLSRTALQAGGEMGQIGLAACLRLAVSPAIAWALTLMLSLTGVTQVVCIVLAGMPTAVNVSILAIEFDARPRFVSRAVLVSTALSFLSLGVLLNWVR